MTYILVPGATGSVVYGTLVPGMTTSLMPQTPKEKKRKKAPSLFFLSFASWICEHLRSIVGRLRQFFPLSGCSNRRGSSVKSSYDGSIIGWNFAGFSTPWKRSVLISSSLFFWVINK